MDTVGGTEKIYIQRKNFKKNKKHGLYGLS